MAIERGKEFLKEKIAMSVPLDGNSEGRDRE